MFVRNDDHATLLSVLERLMKELTDEDIYHVVSGNYYEHQGANRFGQRVYIAQIWLSAESAWDVVLTDEGLICDVLLNPDDLTSKSRILIRYDQIWNIMRAEQEKASTPYTNDSKRDLMMMFKEKPTA